MEKDRARARQIADEIGSIVIAARRLRGQVPRRGRLQPRRRRGRRHRRRRGQPRHLPDGQAPLRRAADDRPGQQPQERGALPAPRRRRADQPDPDDPGLDRAGHPGPRAAPPGGARRGRARAHRGAPPGGLAGDRPRAAGPVDPRRLLAVRGHPRRGRDAAPAGHGHARRATRSSPSASRSARTCSTTSSSASPRAPPRADVRLGAAGRHCLTAAATPTPATTRSPAPERRSGRLARRTARSGPDCPPDTRP